MTYKTGRKFGKKNQPITVYTNDPQNKTVKLSLSLDIQVDLAMMPTGLYFGNLRKGKASAIKTFSLKGLDKDSTRIVSVESNNEYVKAVIVPEKPQGKEPQKINVSILPGMDIGRFMNLLEVHTNHKEKKILRVSVHGIVIGDIMVTPLSLSFGSFKQGGKYSRRLRLTAAQDVSFKILSVEASTPLLITEIVTINEGSRYQLNVKLSDQFDLGTMNEKIIITTDHPEQQKIEVKVSGRSYSPSILRQKKVGKRD